MKIGEPVAAAETAAGAATQPVVKTRLVGPVLAIDPGSSESAWVLLDEAVDVPAVVVHRKLANAEILATLRAIGHSGFALRHPIVVIEQIASYGMAVGAEIFATVHWAGRFYEAAEQAGFRAVVQVPRAEVKLGICGDSRAKDSNIIAAVKDRFGGSAAKGTKTAPGPLYGIRADEWQALALGLAYLQRPIDELEEAF